jgi:NADPH-dependent curcumin reductase CurA
MADERITEVETPSGSTHTHTTVVSDGERSGGGATWVIVLLLIVVAGVALWIFLGMSQSEIAENTAVSEAAGEVGEAAGQVGEAAQQAGDAARDAANR